MKTHSDRQQRKESRQESRQMAALVLFGPIAFWAVYVLLIACYG